MVLSITFSSLGVQTVPTSVIRGTRVPVNRILGGLAGKMTFDKMCQEYDVTVEDVQATINYVEEVVEQETHHPIPWADFATHLNPLARTE